MGTFHYLRTGFVNKPTHHYGRPSFIVSDKLIGHFKHKSCQRNKLSIEVRWVLIPLRYSISLIEKEHIFICSNTC